MSFIKIQGTDLYFEINGSGETLLFLHDGLLDSRCWDIQFNAFARNYQCIRYDRQAYGRSDTPTEPFSILDTIREMLEGFGVKQASLIGGSNGGTIALDFTLAYPQMVKKLVTVGSLVSGVPWSDQFHRRMQAIFLPLLEDENLDEKMEYCAQDPYLMAPENASARALLRNQLMANPSCLVKHGTIAKNGLIIPPNFQAADRLSDIRVPTLILMGEADDPHIHTHSAAIEAQVPDAKRVVIANTGHYPYLEWPDAFNQIVLDFLRKN